MFVSEPSQVSLYSMSGFVVLDSTVNTSRVANAFNPLRSWLLNLYTNLQVSELSKMLGDAGLFVEHLIVIERRKLAGGVRHN
jgi:hypothetical protein